MTLPYRAASFSTTGSVIIRWFLGRPVCMPPQWRPTDATFWRRGRNRFPGYDADRLTFWVFLPEGVRSAIRQWCLFVVFALGYGWVAGGLWWVIGVVGAAATVVFVGYRTGRRWWQWRHRRCYVTPLHAALSDILRIALPESAIKMPLNFQNKTTGAGVTLTLPGDRFYDAKTTQAIKACVAQKLGMPDPTMTTQAMGPHQTVTFTAALHPPDRVRFCDLTDAMDACKPGEVVIGLDAHHHVYKWAMKDGEPHAGFSVQTRRGKSTFGESIVAQILHQHPDNEATYIDPKAVSCESLIGTPGLTLANDPGDIEGMWRAVERVYDILMDRRSQLLTDPTSEFGIHLLVLDELNMFSDMSKDMWREWKDERPEQWRQGDSPVARNLKAIMRMGGQFSIHVAVFAQRLDVAACFGIPGLRDLFGLRGLGGYKANQWKMLIGTTPVPPAQKGRGRWIFSDGDTESWVQLAYGSLTTGSRSEQKAAWTTEVRDWAQAGRTITAAPTVVSTVPCPTSAPQIPAQTRHETGDSTPKGTVVVGNEAAAGALTMSVAGFLKAKQRAQTIGDPCPVVATQPGQGNKPRYELGELEAWATRRRAPHATEAPSSPTLTLIRGGQ